MALWLPRQVFGRLLGTVSFYSFGLLHWFLFLRRFIESGSFFKKDDERDRLQYAIERDRFWNLSKEPLPGFNHHFHTLRNNLKLHYISNRDDVFHGNLVVFFHGFPDTSMVWRHLMQETAMPIQEATFVCVDLPGYGGSDTVQKYDTEVLEALTEFVVAMRDKYIPPDSDALSTFIVGHDWGCMLGFRLAAEAPSLADRFILTNAPHYELISANKDRILSSASKIFKQFRQSPRTNFACLSKSFQTLKPLLLQATMMGYICMFHLPSPFVKYIGYAGNFSFLRTVHRLEYERHSTEYQMQECMAASSGPGAEECKTCTSGKAGESYGPTVLERARSPGEAFWTMTGIYRDGVASKPWTKSLEAITDLYALEAEASESSSPERRRSSTSNIFTDRYPHKGSLRSPTYILWGEKDLACSRPLCLDGIGDYLTKDSEVTILPRSGHWTPVGQESRRALATVIGLLAGRDARTVTKITSEVQKVYEGAVLMVKK